MGIPPGCCGNEYDDDDCDGGVDIIIPPPIFVVADNGEANMIAIPNVNAVTIPKVKEIFLEFIVIRTMAWSYKPLVHRCIRCNIAKCRDYSYFLPSLF